MDPGSEIVSAMRVRLSEKSEHKPQSTMFIIILEKISYSLMLYAFSLIDLRFAFHPS